MYIEDIDDLHMTKIDVKPNRISSTIDGIGNKLKPNPDLSYSPYI
jgi:hypothetical protein